MEQTELAMVNALLEEIEESTILTIDRTHPDVDFALNIWDTESVAIQGMGWWYNSEVYVLTPDVASSEVYLPTGTISIDAVGTTLMKRGRRLYDVEKHSYIFSMDDYSVEDLTITCLMEWALDELPVTVYGYILSLCKIAMVANRDYDATHLNALEKMAGMKLGTLQKQHLRYADPNRLNINNAGLLLSRQVRRYNG